MKLIVIVIFCSWAVLAQQALEVTEALKSHLILAKKIYERTTGVKISLKDPVVEQMAKEIKNNNLIGAAKIATQSPAFTNLRARNFALRLSNKANSVGVDLNDMATMIVGIIRDDEDFREILTSKSHYQIKNITFYKNYLEHSARNPAVEADDKILDLHANIEKISKPPYIMTTINAGKIAAINAEAISQLEKNIKVSEQGVDLKEIPDPAGVLTTNYFAQSQFSGGSNRRGIEFVVKNFLCSSMPEIGNPNASDAFVGRDVDRFVGGSNSNYVNNCKSCHTVMDGLRSAFAKVDYAAFYQDMATGNSALAYGGFANQLADARAVWTDVDFNQSPLEQELKSNGSSSTLVKNTTSAYNLDYSFPLKATYSAEISTTYADKKSKMISTMNSNLLLKNSDGVAAPNATYLKMSQKFNRVLLGLSFRDVVAELAARPRLKEQILINPTLAYSAANAKPAWLAIKNNLHYFVLTADTSVADARDEVATDKKTILYDIFANKTLGANITKYNQICLDKWDQSRVDAQKTESGKNSVRFSMAQAFLICDLEFRKNLSFISEQLLLKLMTNGASAELQTGVSELILINHVNMYFNADRSRREYFTRYLQSQNRLISFGGTNFNGDTGVANKLNTGSFTYGAEVKNDDFTNLASTSFGWRGPNKDGGSGLNQFGRMIADSKAFSSCMTKKIFQTVCYKDLSSDPKLLKKWTQQFELNYKVKNLVADMVVSNDCGLINKMAGN
jgi:hypothetical protein